MTDLIRRGDAREILEDGGFLERSLERLAALPAVTVGVKPLEWQLHAANEGVYYSAFDPLYGREVEAPDEATCDAIDQSRTARILAALEPAAPDLSDPVTVHANMLRGTIAKPTVEQIIHLYGVDALAKALAPVIVREAGHEPS